MYMSKFWLTFGTLLLVFLIGLLDYLIVIDLSLSICYLIPIAIATRYVGKKTGILLSILSALLWYLAEATAKAHLYYLILIWNTLVRLTVFLIIVHLLSALNKAYQKEQRMARIDELTKICNRRYFLDILQTETKRAIRYKRYLTLAYFDVDNFKFVNDRYGHQQGDRLLYLIANTVENTIRETDVVARMGGDEFALLLPEINYKSAHLALQRIQNQLVNAVKNQNFEVGFSIGAVTFVYFPDTTSKMLEQVDFLMYQVKNQGKSGLKHQCYAENKES